MRCRKLPEIHHAVLYFLLPILIQGIIANEEGKLTGLSITMQQLLEMSEEIPLLTPISDQDIALMKDQQTISEEIQPKSSNCHQPGIFETAGPCGKFYLCRSDNQNQNLSLLRITCPSGMTFNRVSLLCVSLSESTEFLNCQKGVHEKLNSQREYQKRISGGTLQRNIRFNSLSNFKNKTRKRRTTNPPNVCSSRDAESLTENVKEICDDIDSIDIYVDFVNGMIPAELFTFTVDKYLTILKGYNDDLSNAKMNTQIWKQGNDSIQTTIRESISATMIYEHLFHKEFEKNVAGIGIFVNKEGKATTIIMENINRLEFQLQTLTKLALSIHNTSDFQVVKAMVENAKEKLNALKKTIIDVSFEYEIPKFINFFRSIQEGGRKVWQKAQVAESKTSTFEIRVLEDASKFDRTLESLQRSLSELANDKKEYPQDLRNLQREKANLNRRIGNVRVNLAKANQRKADALTRLQIIRGNKRRRRSPIPPAVPWILGGLFVGWIGSEILDEDDELEDIISSVRSEIFNYQRQINYLNQEMADYNERLNTLRDRSRELEREIPILERLSHNFKTLEREVSLVIHPISKARFSIAEIRRVFGRLIVELEDIIVQANAASTHLEKMNLKYFIYNKISEMKCNWDKVSDNMANFKKCISY